MKGVANEGWTSWLRKQMELDRMGTRVLEILKKMQCKRKRFWLSEINWAIFFHRFLRICKYLFASLCMNSSNTHFTMYGVLIDGDKRIPGIAVTLLLRFKHSYLSFYSFLYSSTVKKCKDRITKVYNCWGLCLLTTWKCEDLMGTIYAIW